MEEIAMKFSDDNLNDILILMNNDEDLYVVNLTNCTVTNYNPMGSMADVFELINCDEDIIFNENHRNAILECLHDYEEEIDTEKYNQLVKILSK